MTSPPPPLRLNWISQIIPESHTPAISNLPLPLARFRGYAQCPKNARLPSALPSASKKQIPKRGAAQPSNGILHPNSKSKSAPKSPTRSAAAHASEILSIFPSLVEKKQRIQKLNSRSWSLDPTRPLPAPSRLSYACNVM
jgi:hypothetical protein